MKHLCKMQQTNEQLLQKGKKFFKKHYQKLSSFIKVDKKIALCFGSFAFIIFLQRMIKNTIIKTIIKYHIVYTLVCLAIVLPFLSVIEDSLETKALSQQRKHSLQLVQKILHYSLIPCVVSFFLLYLPLALDFILTVIEEKNILKKDQSHAENLLYSYITEPENDSQEEKNQQQVPQQSDKV